MKTPAESLPTAILRPGDADRIVAGHPWVFRTSIDHFSRPAGDGDLVMVKDHRQRTLGCGLYNSKSKLSVRILAPDRIEADEKFFEERISAALALRQRFLPTATSYRVVNAESDLLSGLIVDKYEDVLVVQTSALGMDQRLPQIVAVLQRLLQPRAIFERNDVATRKLEGLPERKGILAGDHKGPITIQLNGLSFAVDLIEGHKTGMYLDQQANYEAVARLIRPGGSVLDCFSFLGGFALHAAKAGAGRVLGLDQSEDAVKAASENAKTNQLTGRCSFQVANVFDWLKTETTTRPHEKLIPPYDAVILDPPSFTRNRESVPNALRGYKEIHVRALKLLKPGGLLATFCCSHHVDSQTFLDTVLSAAYDQRKLLRRVAVYSQSPDHPIIPMIPETEYLKGYAFELIR
jgi:23S rRNA (cytosine1962-C5)-methyltransferase